MVWPLRLEMAVGPRLCRKEAMVDRGNAAVPVQMESSVKSALEGLPGVKKIQSTSLEGHSSIQIQKNEGYRLQRLLDDIRLRLDGIDNLPQEADKPMVSRNDFDFPALIVQLFGDVDTNTLQRLGKQVREELLAQPEISKLKGWGEKTPEIRIELQPEKLEKYKIPYIVDIPLFYETKNYNDDGWDEITEIFFENGTIKGTDEIAKIYQHMDEGKPIQWIKVHNLPDHVYFNHAYQGRRVQKFVYKGLGPIPAGAEGLNSQGPVWPSQ